MPKLAAALLLLAAPAPAQTGRVDAAAVRACLAGAPAREGPPGCAGEAARACLGQPSGNTTLAIAECLMAETRVWEDLMAAALRHRAGGFGRDRPELVGDLEAAQRAWAAYREAECGLRYAIWIEGSIRTIIAGDCHLKKTAARALELRHLAGME